MGAGHGFHHIWEREREKKNPAAKKPRESEQRFSESQKSDREKRRKEKTEWAILFYISRQISHISLGLSFFPFFLPPSNSPSLAGWIYNECFYCAAWQGVATTDISYNGIQLHPIQFKLVVKNSCVFPVQKTNKQNNNKKAAGEFIVYSQTNMPLKAASCHLFEYDANSGTYNK